MNQKRNLGKRIASWLLCMVMVLSIVNLPGFTNTVYAAGYNAGDIPGTTGAGTESDPVLVYTFTELKAALQCSDNLYIELKGMSDTLTGLDYFELEESRDFNNGAPAIIIPAGTTKHLTIGGKADYRILTPNDTYMQALIANNGGNLYVNGNGMLNVGFAGYNQDLTNAVIYNRSGNVYISGNLWITTDKANVENQSLPLYNEGGYMEIDGGYFVGCVNRYGGGDAVALRCGSWATKTVISGGNFSAVNTADPESTYAMGVIGSSPVEISGGCFYKGVKSDNGKTLNDYVVSGKKVYKAEEAWEVCDPKVEEVEIKVPPLVVGKDFPVPECVSDNAYVFDYDWYYSDNRTIADGAKVQNTEYKLHVIVYTDDGKTFDWTSCTIHFNDSTGEVYLYGDTFVNTYAYFTPVEIISGSVGVTDYVAPVVGKEPVKPTKPTGVDYNVSRIWYEVPEIGNQADAKTFTGAFEHGKIYCLALTFTALSGKAFDENIKVSVDGNVVEYERLQNNKIRAVLYTALNHDFSEQPYQVDENGKHYQKCKDCGAESTHEAHTGGTATCKVKAKCTVCGKEYGELVAHSYDTKWSTDATNHWKACTVCQAAKKDNAAHVDANKDGKCDTCSYSMHTHAGTKVDQVDATCSSYGVKAYYKCSCGKYYSDSACTKEITDLAAWKSGDGRIEKKEHTLETTTTKATLTANGKTETKCTVCGEVTKTETIYAAKTIKLSATKYTYDGKVKKPSVTIKDSKGNAIASTNYTVTYPSGRKNVGKYTVKVKFKGNYSGSKSLSFTINPPKTSISKVTAGKKAFTVKWAKKTTQVTGYEIQYSTSSSFAKGNKTVKVTSAKTVSKTISKLTGGKKYYVRIRTYKTVGKTPYYSDWSAKKSVTTKK